MPVPHLAASLSGPILDLERCIIDAMPSYRALVAQSMANAYRALLLLSGLAQQRLQVWRRSDTNLFPGGFNNLNPEFMPLCVQAMMAAVEKVCADARSILLIPESHTRNTFYLQNLATLQTIMRHAGLNIRIGSLLPEITAPTAHRSSGWHASSSSSRYRQQG